MCAAKSAALPSDPALASATELVALYRAKMLSPVEATRAALARIERHNGAVNAWCHLDPDGALAADAVGNGTVAGMEVEGGA